MKSKKNEIKTRFNKTKLSKIFNFFKINMAVEKNLKIKFLKQT